MRDDAFYQLISERHGFSVPDEHRRMNDRGFLTFDPRIGTHDFTAVGKGYLWLNDMEWYSVQEIAEFKFHDCYQGMLPHLVPFAHTIGGDYWCWQTERTDERGTRVLFCPQDYQEATVYAPDFSAALFRQVLHYACFDFEADDDEDEEENRAFLHRWAIDLAGVLPPHWCQTIRDVESRPMTEWQDQWNGTHTSLLDERELKAIEQQQLHFPELDTEVPWFDSME
jgi:hypothetical protein